MYIYVYVYIFFLTKFIMIFLDSRWEIPFEQKYLVIRKADEYYLVPITMDNPSTIEGQVVKSE